MQNFIKTILNAVQTWTKKEIKKSKADWGQNDPSADNYVKNRTHWEETVDGTETRMLTEKSDGITVYLDDSEFATLLREKKENARYFIDYGDGNIEYFYLDNSYSADWDSWEIDNDSGIRNLISINEGMLYIENSGGEHSIVSATITIDCKSKIIHKLDPKYLPDDIDAQSDWNASEGEAGYIKNRPFGKVENVLFEDSIELNDGSYTFDKSLELKYGTLYHVYIDNNKLSGICYYDSPDYYVDLTDSEGNHIGYVYDYAVVFSDGNYYEDGNYNLKIVAVELKQIDSEFIPDSITTAIPAIRTTAESAQATADRKMDEANPVGAGSFSMNRKKNTIIGDYSHAEGYDTTASGNYSHAEGYNTTASYAKQNVSGSYNIEEPEWYIIEHTDISIAFGPYYDVKYASDYSISEDGFFILYDYRGGNHSGVPINTYYSFNDFITIETDSNGNKYAKTDSIYYKKSRTTADNYRRHGANGSDSGKYAHIVGNGTADDARSNAHTLDWEGNAWYSGDVYVGSTSGINKDEGSKKLATEEYVDEALAGFEGNGGGNAESEVMCVTVQSNNDGYTADKTVSEIFEAYRAGKAVVCHVRDLDGNFATNLVVCGSDIAYFSASVGDAVIAVTLTENGVQMEFMDILEGYAKTEDIPTDEHINALINTALGVIENGTY